MPLYGVRWFFIAAALLGPGCDQVIGLDRRSPEVTIRYEIHEVRNAPDGSPTIAVISDPRSFEVVLADGTLPDLVMRPDGALTFERAAEDQVYRLAVRLPDDRFIEYQAVTPTLAIVEPVIGRNDRRAATTGSTVKHVVSNPPAGSTSHVVTTGLWTQTSQDVGGAGATSAAFAFPWAAARSRFGAPGVLLADLHDRAYAMSTGVAQGRRGTAYFALTHGCTHAFSTLGVVPVEMGCTVAPLAFDRCTHVQTRFAAELERIAAVLPAAPHPSYFVGWTLAAMPAPALAPTTDLLLGFRFGRSPSTTPVVEIDDEIPFANPYPGHTVSLLTTASRERAFAVPDASAFSIDTSTRHWIVPDASCEGPEVVPERVTLAHDLVLGDTPLDADERVVVVEPGRELRLTWNEAATGRADLYRVVLHRAGNLFGYTVLDTIRTYVVTERVAVIDPALLVPGATYFLEVESRLGYPAAATGDLGTIGFPATPYATSRAWSSSFRVP
ncbi:MAG: hypothetical protein M3680_04165 [Myxococcota bacterium]|nr:hypothetical protein [Myxococcota bacterium]